MDNIEFFIDRDEPTVFAVMYDQPNGSDMYACYSHIGQHALAHVDYIKECKPATPEQYADLKRELVSIGYNL